MFNLEVNLEDREKSRLYRSIRRFSRFGTRSVRVEANLESVRNDQGRRRRGKFVLDGERGPPGATRTYECILRMHLPAWAASLARQFNTASICHLSY